MNRHKKLMPSIVNKEAPVRLSDEQVVAYLERLGFSEGSLFFDEGHNLNPTKETLDALVYAHQCRIPFSSVDIYQCATPPDLSLDVLFDKIIARGRGGYCFEMNRLFKALLETLGFEVRPVMSRIVLKFTEVRPITHRGALVSLNGRDYYVDVGFGGPVAAGALEMVTDEVQTINGEHYRLRNLDDVWWAIDKMDSKTSGGEEVLCYRRAMTVMHICLAAVEEQDFEAFNLFCAQPGARFRETRVLNLRTETGSYNIDGSTLTVRRGDVKETRELESGEALKEAAERYFSITL